MVSTEQQQNSNMEREALRFRIAKLDYALAQIAPHDTQAKIQAPEQAPAPEDLTYLNPEASATPNNMEAIMDAVNKAYEAPNQG